MTVNAPLEGRLVHIVDDDGAVRRALVRLLNYAGFRTRAYASAAEFLLADREAGPSCVVLDLCLPGMNGVEVQTALAKQVHPPHVVFLTGRGDVETSVQAMKAGAVDFLTKPVKREALLTAVTAALERAAQQRDRLEEVRALRERFDSLTAREREVLFHVVDGRLNKQIAEDLGTSIRTVKAHRARVMEKMRVASIAGLVRVVAQLDTAGTMMTTSIERS